MVQAIQMQPPLALSSWKSRTSFAGQTVCDGVFYRTSNCKRNIQKMGCRANTSTDPLLVQAAKGHVVERPPAWMMRQAGRYMAAYRKVAEKHPSFRERSETTDLIVEISLQPWRAFHPDGVIIFSDILTPLPAFGISFDIDDVKGPIIHTPIRSEEGLKALHPIELDKLQFVGESLNILRKEVNRLAI